MASASSAPGRASKQSGAVVYNNCESSCTLPTSLQSSLPAELSEPGLSLKHQRFVLSDPVAFSYLEEDAATTVLQRAGKLQGYQSYVVEQWACSRTHPTFVITAFTADANHTITVGVLSVPADEKSWSPRLRVYFKSLSQYYARRKDTPLGILMVTNLSTFPSSLTIVLIPNGDLRKHRDDFFVSENLKRLGCSGRVGLSVMPATLPTQAKFYQLYRVSDRIDFYSSVIELVKLCQVALLLFGFLGPEYCDGLLCDVTERAVSDWWLRVGMELYNIEPSDGVLGHTTVAAILGTLIGARNRLNAYGAPVAKDVFDIETTKRAVASFQKSQHLPRTRRIDRVTLDRLHKMTAKQASGDGWTVPKAVKSTVAELSGKSGEMVMEIVGKADKSSIADVETTDIDRFVQLVKGERARWLWHGKSRKRATRELFDRHYDIKTIDDKDSSLITAEEGETSVQSNAHSSKASAQLPTASLVNSTDESRTRLDDYQIETQVDYKDTAFHRAKHKLKEAVGVRGHSRDTPELLMASPSGIYRSSGSILSPDMILSNSTTQADAVYEPRLAMKQSKSAASNLLGSSSKRQNIDEPEMPHKSGTERRYDTYPPTLHVRQSASTANDDSSLEQPIRDHSETFGRVRPTRVELQRNHSVSSHGEPKFSAMVNTSRWPRQLSFSIVEEVMFRRPANDGLAGKNGHSSTKASLLSELIYAEHMRELQSQVVALESDIVRRVYISVANVERLDTLAADDVAQLHSIYFPRRDEYNSLTRGSRDIVGDGRGQVQEAIKDVETLNAQLEYEINALRNKVDEAEDAIAEFETRVAYIEARADDLIDNSSHHAARWNLFNWLIATIKKYGDSSSTRTTNDQL